MCTSSKIFVISVLRIDCEACALIIVRELPLHPAEMHVVESNLLLWTVTLGNHDCPRQVSAPRPREVGESGNGIGYLVSVAVSEHNGLASRFPQAHLSEPCADRRSDLSAHVSPVSSRETTA